MLKLHLSDGFVLYENVLLQAGPFVSVGSFPEFTTFNFGAEVSAFYIYKKLVVGLKLQTGKYHIESTAYNFYPIFVFPTAGIKF